MNAVEQTIPTLIPPRQAVAERLAYHLREARLLQKQLRVSEAAIEAREPLRPDRSVREHAAV